jgi:hypothetical protein
MASIEGYVIVKSILQQIIHERILFLREQISPTNNPQVNRTFQLPKDAIESVNDDMELLELIILKKKALLKNSKDVYETKRLFAELEGFEWLQRQIARHS